MESAEAVAAKRRVLIDAVMMCLQKRRVVEMVDGQTVHRALAFALMGLAVVALSVSAWFAMRDTSTAFDLHDTAAVLQLSNGRAVGPSLTATITDPKWDALSPDDRKRVASQLMDLESQR